MEVVRTRATLHWLIVGKDPGWAAFARTICPKENAVIVWNWPDAVRHLVAYSQVRALVLGAGLGRDFERCTRQAAAMQPGLTVFVASDVPLDDALWARRLSPTDKPDEVLP